MAKRPVGRPEKYPGEKIVYDAFKLPKSLKDKFNKVTYILRHNKTDIFIAAIEAYIAKYEKEVENVIDDYAIRDKKRPYKKRVFKKSA